MRQAIFLAAALAASTIILPVKVLGGGLHFDVRPSAEADQVLFRLELENRAEIPANLEFPTAQFYEIIMSDDRGNILYRYSEGKMFAQVLQKLRMEPKEKVSWVEKMDGAPSLPRGTYRVEAELEAAKNNGKPINQLKAEAELLIPGSQDISEISVSGNNGRYLISGKALPSNEKLYYVVEDGHDQLVTMTEAEVKDGAFKIELRLAKNQLPDSGTLTLILFTQEENGKTGNETPVTLEQF